MALGYCCKLSNVVKCTAGASIFSLLCQIIKYTQMYKNECIQSGLHMNV